MRASTIESMIYNQLMGFLKRLWTKLYHRVGGTDEILRGHGVPEERLAPVRSFIFKETVTFSLLASASSGVAGIGFAMVAFASEKTNPLTIVFGALLMAISLFMMRMRFRVIYGFLEIVFAVAVIYRLASTMPGQPGFAPFGSTLFLIQIFAAIYIIVRGADNFVTGLPDAGRKAVESFVERLLF